LGLVTVEQGDTALAGACFADALRLTSALGERKNVVVLLAGVAGRAAALGRAREAVCLAGAAAALGSRLGVPLSPHDQAAWEPHLARAREALRDDVAAAAWAWGQALTLEQAAAEALRSATA
jgi:hypothetical protein